jgi:hypothetical protein
VLGLVGPVAALGLFYLGDKVIDLSRPELQTMMYLMLSVAGTMTIYLTRTRGPFWSIRPARKLVIAVTGAQIIATVISVGGIFVTALPWEYALLVWGYALAWFLVTDRVKLLAYRILEPETTAIATATSSPAPDGTTGSGPVEAYHATSASTPQTNAPSTTPRTRAHTASRSQRPTARTGPPAAPSAAAAPNTPTSRAQPVSQRSSPLRQDSHMSRNDEPAKAAPDANSSNTSTDMQPPRAPTPWAHSRAEAEAREIIHALSGNHVLTLVQIKELCWASHWPESDFTTTLHHAIAAGEIKQLGEDLYEIPESRRHNP